MLTSRQEAFCRGLAEGLSQYEAYKKAGYRSQDRNAIDANAAALVRNHRVAKRLNELKSEAAKRTAVTVESIAAELEASRLGAMAEKQFAAANQASLGKAKLCGLVIDKAEVEQKVTRKPSRDPSTPSRMTVEEWEAKYAPRQ